MWHPTKLPSHDIPGFNAFVETINRQGGLFEEHSPLFVARAPGRLDLMGGIADYSGALVLELPLACATFVAAQLVDEPVLLVRSLLPRAVDALEVRVLLAELAPNGICGDEAAVHHMLTADQSRAWAAYALGPLAVLARGREKPLSRGLRLLVASDVPPGKGVSSSAALEVAALLSMAAALELPVAGREAALLCQRAENLVVGAPCGVMDQMTVACGEQGQLLALLCQPAELETPVSLPDELEVWAIDSGIRHAVGGSDYGAVRTGAFMGYRLLAQHAGLPVAPAGPGRVQISDQRWGGYLANLGPAEWEQHYRAHVPTHLGGADFLARYGGITDHVTSVDPARTYAVRAPTAHPIWEHQRVRLFRSLLLAGSHTEETYALLGELMYQAHASYSACGLGSAGTDRLVELARRAGPPAGIYGAKITGGGSGGSVAFLARKGSAQAIANLAQQYAQETGHPAAILGGSSPGAVAYGVHPLVFKGHLV